MTRLIETQSEGSLPLLLIFLAVTGKKVKSKKKMSRKVFSYFLLCLLFHSTSKHCIDDGNQFLFTSYLALLVAALKNISDRDGTFASRQTLHFQWEQPEVFEIWNEIFYLHRLFRVVWFIAAWETGRRIITFEEDSWIFSILFWPWRDWLRTGASSLWQSCLDWNSWSKRCRFTKLGHFSYTDSFDFISLKRNLNLKFKIKSRKSFVGGKVSCATGTHI